MLLRKHDAAGSEGEWRNFLTGHDFGQLIASGRDRDVSVVVPAHYVFDGTDEIFLHLARDNPVFPALRENPRGIMAVVGAYHYIPTNVNSQGHWAHEFGVPTSYYAAVQAIGTCHVEDGEKLAELLNRQLRHFQPEGGHAEVQSGDNPYGRQLDAIRGIVMRVEEVRSKFKFGGNKTVEHRLSIAEWLGNQPGDLAREARSHLLRRMPGAERSP